MLVSDTDGLRCVCTLYVSWDCTSFWLVAVSAHSLKILVHVFVDPSASFHFILGLLWVLFVFALSGIDDHFLLDGGILLHCDFCAVVGGAGSRIVMTSGGFPDFGAFVGTRIRLPTRPGFFLTTVAKSMKLFSFSSRTLARPFGNGPSFMKSSKAFCESGKISMKLVGSLNAELLLSTGGCVISSTDARRAVLGVGFALAINLLSLVFSLFFVQHVLLVRGSPPFCSAAIFLCLTTGLGLSSPSSALSADSRPSGGWLMQLGGIGLIFGELGLLVGLRPWKDSANWSMFGPFLR